MTFDEVMNEHHGKWDGDNAVIMDQGGYYWVVATGKPENFELTEDGRRYITTYGGAGKHTTRRGRKPNLSVDATEDEL